ncbi:hypothetical protein K490DRAFT_55255 [Saccharata proteae CBS 121410]|uniref:Uncharacterized protein n=1 Tax=Saccharata proteae CBS 121410 TaxID=1314787 RepID=A0A6A5YCQ2_9PEZI|nr:hypothetical protein K490DRAFT_55255 [Saccharata proteae CBS 121410]
MSQDPIPPWRLSAQELKRRITEQQHREEEEQEWELEQQRREWEESEQENKRIIRRDLLNGYRRGCAPDVAATIEKEVSEEYERRLAGQKKAAPGPQDLGSPQENERERCPARPKTTERRYAELRAEVIRLNVKRKQGKRAYRAAHLR